MAAEGATQRLVCQLLREHHFYTSNFQRNHIHRSVDVHNLQQMRYFRMSAQYYANYANLLHLGRNVYTQHKFIYKWAR